MGGEKFDYSFVVTSPTRYELVLTAVARNRLFTFLFNKARGKLSSKGVTVPADSDPERVDQIEIIPQYLKLVGTFIHKQVKEIERAVEKDKIKVVSRRVVRARFIRAASRDWNLEITINGDCADER